MRRSALDAPRPPSYPTPPERGYGEKVSRELPKLKLRVRFSLPAPDFPPAQHDLGRDHPYHETENGRVALLVDPSRNGIFTKYYSATNRSSGKGLKLARLRDLLNDILGSLPSRTGHHDDPLVPAVCISMVKNEQDVIEPFLRHNHRFFDLMIVLDNNSSDLTRPILRDCARELGNVVLVDLPDFAYRQSEIMTNAMHHVQGACFADFVAFLDADEFIDAPDRETFLSCLSTIPVGECALLPWHTFLPDPTATGTADPMDAMTLKRRLETPQYFKAIMRFGGAIDQAVIVVQGNHEFKRKVSPNKFKNVVPHPMTDLALMHFPLRSLDQMCAKGVIGWKANLARNSGKEVPSEAYQWKRIHDIANDPVALAQPEVLSTEAMAYAQSDDQPDFHSNSEPAEHGIDCTRRYSDGSFTDLAELIASMEKHVPMAGQDFTLPNRSKSISTDSTEVDTAFTSDWHWENLFLDAPPFRFLVEKHLPQSVLDIGCGSGAYLHLLKSAGVPDILGIDGMPRNATVLDAHEYTLADLQNPFDCGKKFDLVMCIEVVEHLEPNSTPLIIDTIAKHARDMILFSMADLGQPGNGHINCQSMDDVLNLWADRGWTPELNDTLAVRSISTLSWLRRNLLVLRPTSSNSARNKSATEVLQKIGAMEHIWYSQPPSIRLAPFKEVMPGRDFGYRQPRA